MDHKAEIAVQASQIEKIKNLQVEVKKEIMRQGGELDALTYELMSHLDRFEVDSKPLQELVDRRYKLQLNLDRFLVNSFIELRNILDETQYAKYKELWERYYKG